MSVVDILFNKDNKHFKMIKDKNKAFRLVFIEIIKDDECRNGIELKKRVFVSSPFKMVKSVKFNDVCKVISYLVDRSVEVSGEQIANVRNISSVADILPGYGFKKLKAEDFNYTDKDYLGFECFDARNRKNKISCVKEAPEVVDLIVVGHKDEMFSYCDARERYFEWYNCGVTISKFNSIVNKIIQEKIDNEDFEFQI